MIQGLSHGAQHDGASTERAAPRNEPKSQTGVGEQEAQYAEKAMQSHTVPKASFESAEWLITYKCDEKTVKGG